MKRPPDNGGGMTYIRVTWSHTRDDEPVLLLSELDAERWEVRKVEVLPIDDIRADPQFEPTEIGRSEFEQVWAKYATRT